MPKLENWSVVADTSNPFRAPELQSRRLYGEIYDDEKGRFEDGSPISTSTIQEFNLKEGYAMTRNTKYILGEPNEKYLEWLSENNMSLEDFIK